MSEHGDAARGRRIFAAGAVFLVLLCSRGAARGNESEPGQSAPVNAGPNQSTPPKPSIWVTLREQFNGPDIALPEPEGAVIGQTPARMTMREAVAAALQNNPGLIGQSLTPVIQEQAILGAQARFDPLLGSEGNYGRRTVPTVSSLQTGLGPLVQPIYRTSDQNWNLFAVKGLRTGGNLRFDWTNNRNTTNSSFQDLVPQYKPEAIVSLNQPLLRGFGLYFTQLRIRIAETATDAAIEDYRASVSNFIAQVVRAYWDVVLTNEQLRVTRDSLGLAQQTVSDNRTRVDVGVLPPVAIKESEAEAARREEDVIVAENALYQAKRVLQQVVYLPGAGELIPKPVDPVDRPTSQRVEVDPERALNTAVAQRPEVLAARLNIKSNELVVAYNKNQLLPKVDVYGSYGINALSGRHHADNDPLTFDTPYAGTYGDGLGRMFTDGFYSYQGGIKIEVPIGNAQAESDYNQSAVQQQQAFARYRQKISDVTLEVGKAVGDVVSNMKRIEATRVARELAEENLRNQTKRYEVGMVTTTDLLKFQNEVTSARLSENEALIAYNNSLTEFDRAQGKLLAQYNVTVEARKPTSTAWWAQF